MHVYCKETCSSKHDLMFNELLFSAKNFSLSFILSLFFLHHFIAVLMTMNVIASVEIIIT